MLWQQRLISPGNSLKPVVGPPKSPSHCCRSGSKFDLGFQQKFEQEVNFQGKCYQKMHISKFSIEGTYFSSYLQYKIIFHILRNFFPIFEIYIRFYISNMNLVQNYNKINFWPCFYQKQPNFRISVEQVPLQNILKYTFSGSIYTKNSPPTGILVGTPNQTYFRFCSSVPFNIDSHKPLSPLNADVIFGWSQTSKQT